MICPATASAGALRPAARARGRARDPADHGCRRPRRARRCRPRCRSADAVHNVGARRRCSCSGSRRDDFSLIGARPARPHPPAAPARALPALDGAGGPRRGARRGGRDDLRRRPDRAVLVPLAADRQRSSSGCRREAPGLRRAPRRPSRPAARTCRVTLLSDESAGRRGGRASWRGRPGRCWCTGRATTTGRCRRASSTRASRSRRPRCARWRRRPGCAAGSARELPSTTLRRSNGPPEARALLADGARGRARLRAERRGRRAALGHAGRGARAAHATTATGTCSRRSEAAQHAHAAARPPAGRRWRRKIAIGDAVRRVARALCWSSGWRASARSRSRRDRADDGLIGPANKIQPSGRKLEPAGKLTRVGNHPGRRRAHAEWPLLLDAVGGTRAQRRAHRAGGAAAGGAGAGARRGARRKRGYKRCVKRSRRSVGRVVQVIPMPGAQRRHRDGARRPHRLRLRRRASRAHEDQQAPAGTPGKEGDVIHVLRYDPRTGRASGRASIPVPPPGDAPLPQNFPPTETTRRSWPRDLAVSPRREDAARRAQPADSAAIIDTASKAGRATSRSATTRTAPRSRATASTGLVSNEADGTVSVIDLAARDEGEGHPGRPAPLASRGDRDRPEARPRLRGGHGPGPDRRDRPAEARRSSARYRSSGRRGIGTAPVEVQRDARRLLPLCADSGEDALAVFALPNARGRTCRNQPKRRRRARRALVAADSIIKHEAAALPAAGRARGSSSAACRSAPIRWTWTPTPQHRHARVARPRRGSASGRTRTARNPLSPNDSDDHINNFQYLPSIVRGASRHPPLPDDTRLAPADARARRGSSCRRTPRRPPAGHADRAPGGPIKHVFYIVTENRTYDQILGDDPRGDGDPKLTLFGENITPNAARAGQALPAARPRVRELGGVDRRPLLDRGGRGVRLRRQELAPELRRPRAALRLRRLRGHLAGAGLPLRPGREAGHLVLQLRRGGRGRRAAVPGQGPQRADDLAKVAQEVRQVRPRRAAARALLPERRLLRSACNAAHRGSEVYDSSLPPGALPPARSRASTASGRSSPRSSRRARVPAFNYMVLPNDHTAGHRARPPHADAR